MGPLWINSENVALLYGGGGGGGVFLAGEEFWRMFAHSFPVPPPPFFFFFEISSRALIPLSKWISSQWLSELRRLWPSVP